MTLLPDLLTNENLFLIILSVIWIIGAIIQDLKRREVDNLWNFSLIAFALAYRFSVSIYTSNFWFFINGLIGLFIFLILGNIFYYSRLFAGGDAKLLIALGSILPLSYNWLINFKIFGFFVLLFLLGGSIYVFIWSLFLTMINWSKFSREFAKQLRNHKNIFLICLAFFVVGAVASFIRVEFILSAIFLLFFILFIYSKAVEESCLVKAISTKELTEGDWLYEDIYVNGRKIEKSWHGVSKEELSLIRKKYRRKILVKYGIPFTPSFLIGFLGVLWIIWSGIGFL